MPEKHLKQKIKQNDLVNVNRTCFDHPCDGTLTSYDQFNVLTCSDEVYTNDFKYNKIQ